MTRRHPPFAQPSQRPVVDLPQGVPEPRDGDEFPPIEQFLDELPSIEDYLAAEPASGQAEGWADTRWQSFDWEGLAALGRPGSGLDEADASWRDTDWTAGSVAASGRSADTSNTSGGSAADEIAAALDGIAKRIRSGELQVDQFRGMPPEAAIAAALASLIRPRS